MAWPKGKKRVMDTEPASQMPEAVVPEFKNESAVPHGTCKTCGHKDEMHHMWIFDGTNRTKDFSSRRPCQHACVCSEFK